MLKNTSHFPSSEENPETGHTVSLDFQINMYAVSGLKVDTLRVFHEGYKPYKVCYECWMSKRDLLFWIDECL